MINKIQTYKVVIPTQEESNIKIGISFENENSFGVKPIIIKNNK